MPFAFLLLGVIFITAGVRGTDDQLVTLIKGDFTSENGKPSFIAWLVAILLVGALGYIEPVKPVSRAFLVLIVVVLFLSNGGFFEKFIAGTIGTQQQNDLAAKLAKQTGTLSQFHYQKNLGAFMSN